MLIDRSGVLVLRLTLGASSRLRKEPMHAMVVLCSAAMVCANFAYFGLLFALPVYLEAAGYKVR